VLALSHADPIRAGFLNKKRVLKWFENIGYTIYVLTLVSHVSVAVSDIITLETGRFRGSSVIIGLKNDKWKKMLFYCFQFLKKVY